MMYLIKIISCTMCTLPSLVSGAAEVMMYRYNSEHTAADIPVNTIGDRYATNKGDHVYERTVSEVPCTLGGSKYTYRIVLLCAYNTLDEATSILPMSALVNFVEDHHINANDSQQRRFVRNLLKAGKLAVLIPEAVFKSPPVPERPVDPKRIQGDFQAYKRLVDGFVRDSSKRGSASYTKYHGIDQRKIEMHERQILDTFLQGHTTQLDADFNAYTPNAEGNAGSDRSQSQGKTTSETSGEDVPWNENSSDPDAPNDTANARPRSESFSNSHSTAVNWDLQSTGDTPELPEDLTRIFQEGVFADDMESIHSDSSRRRCLSVSALERLREAHTA